MKPKKIALNLYSVRRSCADEAGLDATLARVRAAGYPAVQVSGVGPIPPRTVRRLLDEHGLACCACHEKLTELRTGFDGIVEKLGVLGCTFTALGYPGAENVTADALPRLIGELEDWGRRFAAAGIRFGYHNHALEFERFDGRLALELMLEKTDPRHLAFELDTYWVQYGGGDPVDWINRVRGRMPAIHLKDYAVSSNVPHFAEVGYGNLDWRRILAACRETGVEWYIVEQDEPLPSGRDIFESVALSYEFLAKNVEPAPRQRGADDGGEGRPRASGRRKERQKERRKG
jgi:sugar phosphate isomerase/epimerase